MVISLFLSASTAKIFFFCEAATPIVTTSAAIMPIIAITVSNSISVKAIWERSCLFPLVFMVVWLSIGRTRSHSLFPNLLFHSFAEPLFNHALVIEIARARQALDPGQHARIDAQSNRDRISQLTAGRRDRGLHEPHVNPVISPKRRLRFFAVEQRNLLPTGNGIHKAYYWASVWFSLR